MSVRIKADVNLEELRKFGFKTGKEWADAGEQCLQGIGYAYQHGWWHKFLMDKENPEKVLYADDFDNPVVHITVRTEYMDVYMDIVPCCSYHIGGSELDIVTETIMELTEAGLLEAVSDEE